MKANQIKAVWPDGHIIWPIYLQEWKFDQKLKSFAKVG